MASMTVEASKTSASRIVMPLPEGGLLVGILNKRRYWTRSRARLCAMHIVDEHLEDNFYIDESK